MVKFFFPGILLAFGGLLFLDLEKKQPANALSAQEQIMPDDPGNPVELGAVHWLRKLPEGEAESRRTGKPLLMLFQEVPGCSNCTRYGSVTLRHPLIVEAIETYFVPVCIYNNEGGSDAEALRRFNEPAWNNPVVRIINADGTDLVPRMPDFRSSAEIVNGMKTALEKTGQTSPAWLNLVLDELSAREAGIKTALFSM